MQKELNVPQDVLQDIFVLSPMQQGILLHALQIGGPRVYQEQVYCRLRGRLDQHAFRASWESVVQRHEILRSSFVWQGVDEPLQVVHRCPSFAWKSLDWSHLSDDELDERVMGYLLDDRQEAFELSELPL